MFAKLVEVNLVIILFTVPTRENRYCFVVGCATVKDRWIWVREIRRSHRIGQCLILICMDGKIRRRTRWSSGSRAWRTNVWVNKLKINVLNNLYTYYLTYLNSMHSKAVTESKNIPTTNDLFSKKGAFIFERVCHIFHQLDWHIFVRAVVRVTKQIVKLLKW
jgi:hypothetical protein